MIDLETMDGQITGKVVEVKDDPHNPDGLVLVVETESGLREDVVLTADEVRKLNERFEAN